MIPFEFVSPASPAVMPSLEGSPQCSFGPRRTVLLQHVGGIGDNPAVRVAQMDQCHRLQCRDHSPARNCWQYACFTAVASVDFGHDVGDFLPRITRGNSEKVGERGRSKSAATGSFESLVCAP